MPSTQTPPIRSSQLDPAGSGNSVNLFRGDVNLTQSLFTLPGLTEGDGLELSVSLQYQSNVARAAGTWNADAPTSVVGLGWSLPLSYIAATAGSSPVPSTRQYVLVDNGTPNQLVRQPIHPLLLQLDLAHADALGEGTVPAALRDTLRASGVALSADALIRGTGPWTIQDDRHQRELLLEHEDGHLALREGGEVYQRQNYAFGTIVYYARYEVWVVTSASGLRRVFGGRAPDVGGMAASRGNSIRWEVWQTNTAGRPVCRCAVDTNSADSQVQVASAWYLVAASDRFGNALTCEYNDWDRVSGVIPHAERRVGAQGLAYTRAMYLSRVTDVMGRVARFTYTDKQWESAPDQPREYFDPHTTAPPDETPSPYQDAYETLALTDIQVENADGAPLFGFAFTYALASAAAVTGSLVGDTTKRLLAAIEQRDADGVPLPALRFSYDTAPATSGGQPGALRSVTGPSGSVTDYTYTPMSIGVERSLDVPIPASFVGKGAAQRVFFGPDYAVVTCVSTEGAVSMQIHTWTGVWLSWQLDDTTPVIDTQSKAQVTTLEVLPGADFVTLSFLDAALARRVYVFSRDPARPGVWAPATIRTATGTTTIAANAPLTYGQSATLAGGASFLVVGQMDAAHPDQPGTYDVITWRWTDRAFTAETRTTASYAWITAANEYYAVLTRGDRVLTLRALDGALVWRDAATTTVGALPEMGSAITGLQLVPGGATLAVSYATSPTTTRRSVSMSILSWDDRYTLAQAEYDALSCYHDATQDLTWIATPQIVSDTLIGVAGHLFRRTGAGWSHTENLCPPSTVTGTQTYAYGPDCGVRVISGSTSVTVRVVAYDPTRGPDAAWSAATEPADAHTLTRTQTNAPSLSGDWLVIGPLVYTRGQATNWADVVLAPAAFNLSTYTQFQSGSLLNLAPGFLAFNINDGAYRLRALLLQNGGVVSTTALDSERLSTVPAFGQGSPGSGMFFSFANTASSCDTASGVTLRAWAAEAIDGPITHHAVTRADVDDGLAPAASTCFTYDTDTAGCDATGDIVKFYRATTWPGAATADTARNGRVESEFFNGRESGDDRYDMLDGLPSCTRTYTQDGTCVSSVTSSWTVFPTVASNPWSDRAPVRLRGGWVACTGTTSVTDGAITTTSTTYTFPGMTLPFNGQPTARERGQYSPIQGGFRQELYRRETTYAARHYPAALAIGALADVVQVTDTRVVDGVSTPITSTVTTYAAFDTVAGVRTLATEAQFALAGASTTFDFHGYTPGDSPAGWAMQERVRARMPRGQERETVDARGVPTANVFDRSGRIAVASLVNATAAGAAWLGFQAYEDTRGWTLTGVEMDDTVAYAGVRSARVAAGGSVRVAVTASGDRYVVGCRYRTGSVAPEGGIEATFGTDVVRRAWEATDGAWRYVSLGVAVGEGALEVVLRNDGGDDLHVDSVLVAPLRCGATLQTFDPVTLLPLAISDTAGRAMRTAYDRAGIAAVTVGVNGEVQGVKQAFLSRAGNADDSFDAASPNLTLDLDPAGGGTLETFRDGGDWANRWAPTGSWSAVDGALRTDTGTLTWKGDAGGDTFALHVEVSGGTFQVAVGDIAISWDGAAYRCSRGWTALGAPARMARRWCLVVGEGVVLFFGDGQLLYSEAATPSAPTLTIQAAGVALRNLLVGTQVRLGLSYTDAAGRPVQHQQLHGADAYVRGVVYDVLGRKVATTRSALVDGTLLCYRPTFAVLADDWVMSGEIADAWPEDEGYPYWGTRYEASSRSRRVELGQPGRALAIGGTTTALDYGTNAADCGVPAGAFQETACAIAGDTAIARTASLSRDPFGQPVGLTWRGPDGEVLGQAEGIRDVALGAAGPRLGLSVRMPNALVAGPQQEADGYVRSVAVDARRHPVGSADADTGTTRFVTDAAGNVRFVVPTVGDGEAAYLVYTHYDELGRVVEQGTLDGDYPTDTLQPLADQPEFPENGRPSVVTAWDGDGNDPTAIGQKVSTTTTNRVDGEPDCTVVETFAYDVGGNVISVTQVVDGPVQAEATLGYAYNALAEVIRVDLPTMSVRYIYDDLGGVSRVEDGEGVALGTFAYDAERQVATQTCGAAWVRRQAYTSQGWVRSISIARPDADPSLSLAMDYDGDGMMRGRSLTSAIAGWPSRAERFGYDARRRLASATGDGSLGYTYDPNGNVWEVDEGESASTFTCAPGNNRVDSVRIAGGDAETATYDARGNLTQALGRTFTYDRANGATTTVRTTEGGIRLAYGGSRQRVLKQGASTTVYFCGAGLVPVAMLVDGAWTVMVQGPTGLLACITGGRVLYPQPDASGSVWAVLDASGLVGATHYGPYGEIRATYGTPEAVPAGYQGHAWDAEVGLHDFGARLYDPVLRRFLTPDPQRQYASPYVFADGTPLTIVDPTGELGIGARIGIGVGLAVLAVAGAVLTAGVADGFIAGALATEEAVSAGLAAGSEIEMVDLAAEGTAEAVAGSAAGGSAAAGEVGAGVTAEVNTATKVAQTAVNLAGNAMKWSAVQAFRYNATHGQNYSGRGFAIALGVGAAAGFAGGVIQQVTNAVAAPLEAEMGFMQKALFRGAVNAGNWVMVNDTQQILTNVAMHRPWYAGLASTTEQAFEQGFLRGSVAASVTAVGKQTDAIRVSDARQAGYANRMLTTETKTKMALSCLGMGMSFGAVFFG